MPRYRSSFEADNKPHETPSYGHPCSSQKSTAIGWIVFGSVRKSALLWRPFAHHFRYMLPVECVDFVDRSGVRRMRQLKRANHLKTAIRSERGEWQLSTDAAESLIDLNDDLLADKSG